MTDSIPLKPPSACDDRTRPTIACLPRLALSVTAAAATMSLCCCRPAQMVKVTDIAGVPIAGAEVTSVSLSTNSSPALTDLEGTASLPSSPQSPRWVSVSKPGYQSESVPVPPRWPLHVILHASK